MRTSARCNFITATPRQKPSRSADKESRALSTDCAWRRGNACYCARTATRMVEARAASVASRTHSRVVHLKGTFGGSSTQSIRLLTEGLWVRIPPPELREARVERCGPRAFPGGVSARRVGRAWHCSGQFWGSVGLATLACSRFRLKSLHVKGRGVPRVTRARAVPVSHQEAGGKPCGGRPSWPCSWQRDVSASRRLLTGRHRHRLRRPAGRGEVPEGHAQRPPRRADEPRRAARRARAAHGAHGRDPAPRPEDGPEQPSRRSSTVYQHDEEGLQSIAIDPNFEDNHWVYVYYSPPLNTPSTTRRRRHQRGRRAGDRHRRRDFAPFKG